MKNNPLDDKEKLRRKHRVTLVFNDLELAALEAHCKKYGVENRATFIRETVMGAILRKREEDHPRLFEVEPIAQPQRTPDAIQPPLF